MASATTQPPLIVIAVPIRPQGTVRWAWARHYFKTVIPYASGPGSRVAEIYADEGEPIVEAYERLTAEALEMGAEFVWYLEDDILPSLGAGARLFETLRQPEHHDVAAVGGVYFWRSGPLSDFPLIIPRDGQGPLLDWTPGDLIEVECPGQGCLMVRTAALVQCAKPWWRSDWARVGDPHQREVVRTAADHFLFHRLRAEGWRILVDTRVTCEHQEIDTGEVFPRDPAVRARYGSIDPLTGQRREYGYELENELTRRAAREHLRRGVPFVPSLTGPTTDPRGDVAVPASPPFRGQGPEDATPVRAPGVPGPAGTGPGLVEVCNLGWNGVPVRPDVLAMLPGRLGVAADRLVVVNVDQASCRDAIAAADPPVANATHVWVADHHLREFADGRFAAVWCNHVLEHVPAPFTVDFLRACYRIVADGGFLFFGVPNARRAAEFVQLGKLDFPVLEVLAPTPNGTRAVTAEQILMGGQKHPGDCHYTLWTLERLRQRLYEAGISAPEMMLAREDLSVSVTALIQKGRSLHDDPRLAVPKVHARVAPSAAPPAPAAHRAPGGALVSVPRDPTLVGPPTMPRAAVTTLDLGPAPATATAVVPVNGAGGLTLGPAQTRLVRDRRSPLAWRAAAALASVEPYFSAPAAEPPAAEPTVAEPTAEDLDALAAARAGAPEAPPA